MYIYDIFLIQPSVDGPLGCYHVLAMVHSAPMNTEVHFLELVFLFFSGCLSGSGIAGLCGSYILNFLAAPPYCFPQWLHQFTFPSTACKCSLPPNSSSTFVICKQQMLLFDDRHSDRCNVISHFWFDLHLPNNWASFYVPVSHLYVFVNISLQVFYSY